MDEQEDTLVGEEAQSGLEESLESWKDQYIHVFRSPHTFPLCLARPRLAAPPPPAVSFHSPKNVHVILIIMEHLIESARKRPCLWQLDFKEYKDNELKEAAWEEVFNECDFPSDCLKNKLSVSTPPQDQRGRHIPKNKTSDDQVQNVKSFIEKFPTYESHYTLHKRSDRLFLPPELNITKMYSLYCEQSATPLSYYMFSKIFNANFNLSFHPPISDSCKRCDMLNIKMQACDNEEEKSHLETQRKLHLLKADSARNNYNKDKEEAKVNCNNTQ
ncbi:unnamed protein product [Pieris macdunnoughi]|uniref:MADF domain-containing protein n=1 Tax=Pieris macdunnoughi TaxID=345717 RepID=A0A821XMZ5_9NEOP|nr:unnamed protein product [Pieris macdunnoughi]